MKKTRRIFAVFFLLFLVAAWLPLVASANSPMPADHLSVRVNNVPAEAKYADLLIRLPEDDPNYVSFQSNGPVQEPSQAAQLVNYCEDGFRSFTFHYRNAASDFQLTSHIAYNPGDHCYAYFCRGSEYREFLTQYETLLRDYRDIKIVLLDENFSILQVSRLGALPEDKFYLSYYGDVIFDAATGEVTADTGYNFFGLILAAFLSVELLILSIGIEVALAPIFRLRGKQVLTVFLTNLATQISMRLLYLFLPLPYLVETMILELMVYTGEFFLYRWRFRTVPLRRILVYTVVANTVSLLLGILLDVFIL